MEGNGRTLNCELLFEDGQGNLVGKGMVYYKSSYHWRPGGAVYVCPECGDCWGKVKVMGVWASHYSPLSAPCSKHGGGAFVSTETELEYQAFEVSYEPEVLAHDFVTMYDCWGSIGGVEWGGTVGSLPIGPGSNKDKCMRIKV